mgnify:CR=1 FL=1
MKKYSRILAVCLALSLLAACGAPAPAGTDGPACLLYTSDAADE